MALLAFLGPAGQRMAGRGDAGHQQETRQITGCLVRQRGRHVETPGEQMRRRHSGLHSIGFGIERAQAHRPRKVLDGAVGFAVPDPQKSAKKPAGRQVGIEHHRPVVQGDADIEVAGEVGERMAASRQRDRIVAPEFDGPASQARALGRLPLGSIIHPLTLRQR